MPLSSETGHARIAELLRQAVARNSVPQSLIFAGPEGSGARAMAVALAQAVNCPNQKDGDACGACATCARIARGDHSDVILASLQDGKASIGVPQMREQVLNAIGFRPFEGRRRVFIIDPADAVTPEGQDALLKTLEEPPPAAILILVTAYPDSLARTVQSRCRRLRFEKAADAPNAETDADVQAAVTFLMASAEKSVVKKLKASAAIATVKGDRRMREALSTRLEIVSSLLRDLSALLAGEITAVKYRDAGAELRSLAAVYDQPRVIRAWAALQRAQQAVDRNGSPKIVADWTVLSL